MPDFSLVNMLVQNQLSRSGERTCHWANVPYMDSIHPTSAMTCGNQQVSFDLQVQVEPVKARVVVLNKTLEIPYLTVRRCLVDPYSTIQLNGRDYDCRRRAGILCVCSLSPASQVAAKQLLLRSNRTASCAGPDRPHARHMALVLVEQKGPSPVPPYGVAGALAVPHSVLLLQCVYVEGHYGGVLKDKEEVHYVLDEDAEVGMWVLCEARSASNHQLVLAIWS
mmetsp:Transcript_26688/g.58829  ORF Transcript_26688/g.58829 Transcript_26688/m.58829 type:complete len:223 (-) Transcript_26688:14-682(-)